MPATMAVALLVATAAAGACGKMPLPLREEAQEDVFQPEPGCIFGNEFYELEHKWHPKLDFGTMYCTECSCNAVVKKGQQQQTGKVSCRRIAGECPDVSKCSETAVLPPNSCCKVCPENGEFYALLTGSFSAEVSSDAVAAAHLLLQKTMLHISLDITRNTQARSVQLVDEQRNGKVVFEHFVTSSDNSRVCAVWLTAFEHKDLLKQSQLSLVLTTRAYPLGELKGVVLRQPPAAVQATFLSLLTAPSLSGYGGLVTIGLTTSDNVLHVRGMVDLAGTAGSTHDLAAEMLRDAKQIEKTNLISRIDKGRLHFSYSMRDASPATLKQLARGRLSMVVQTKSGARLLGSIAAWHPCGALQALMSGLDATTPTSFGAAGSAKVTLLENGHLEYQIRLVNLEQKVTGVSFEASRMFGAGSKIFRVTKDIERNGASIAGVHDKVDARDIQLLLEGKIFVNVETREQPDGALRGPLQLLPYSFAPAKDGAEPLIMTSPKSGMAAMAWCGRSKECFLVCQIIVPLKAAGHGASTQAYIESWEQKVLLANFGDATVMNGVISQRDLAHLAMRPMVRIVSRNMEVAGQITVPQFCNDGFNGISDHSPVGDGVAGDLPSVSRLDVNVTPEFKCIYEGRIFEDGETWRPSLHDLECATCSCKRNKVQCHHTLCPTLACTDTVLLPGECCRSCATRLHAAYMPALVTAVNFSRKCYFPGDKRHHAIGSTWHPYIHPFGYVPCAVCFCKEDGIGYDCKQVQCPPLTCSEQVAERRSDGDCCKVCPGQMNSSLSVPNLFNGGHRMHSDDAMGTWCHVGDMRYAHGETFHPKLGSIFVADCVICTCKESRVQCQKVECNCQKKGGAAANRRTKCCQKACGANENSTSISKKFKKPFAKHTRV